MDGSLTAATMPQGITACQATAGGASVLTAIPRKDDSLYLAGPQTKLFVPS